MSAVSKYMEKFEWKIDMSFGMLKETIPSPEVDQKPARVILALGKVVIIWSAGNIHLPLPVQTSRELAALKYVSLGLHKGFTNAY